MIILRTGGPVISTLRSNKSSGVDKIVHADSLICRVSYKKSGVHPESSFCCILFLSDNFDARGYNQDQRFTPWRKANKSKTSIWVSAKAGCIISRSERSVRVQGFDQGRMYYIEVREVAERIHSQLSRSRYSNPSDDVFGGGSDSDSSWLRTPGLASPPSTGSLSAVSGRLWQSPSNSLISRFAQGRRIRPW